MRLVATITLLTLMMSRSQADKVEVFPGKIGCYNGVARNGVWELSSSTVSCAVPNLKGLLDDGKFSQKAVFRPEAFPFHLVFNGDGMHTTVEQSAFFFQMTTGNEIKFDLPQLETGKWHETYVACDSGTCHLYLNQNYVGTKQLPGSGVGSRDYWIDVGRRESTKSQGNLARIEWDDSTALPNPLPTAQPTATPTVIPTKSPTRRPSASPSSAPTIRQTLQTSAPTGTPPQVDLPEFPTDKTSPPTLVGNQKGADDNEDESSSSGALVGVSLGLLGATILGLFALKRKISMEEENKRTSQSYNPKFNDAITVVSGASGDTSLASPSPLSPPVGSHSTMTSLPTFIFRKPSLPHGFLRFTLRPVSMDDKRVAIDV